MTAELICIWLAFTQTLLYSINAETTLTLSTPINPVPVDGILVLHCQIWNIHENHNVMIVRTTNGRIDRLTTGKVVLPSTAEERIFLSVRTFPDGSNVYVITMVNVNLNDDGVYRCSVSTMSDIGDLQTVARDSTNIRIKQFPGVGNPSCTNQHDSLVYQENGVIDLTCSSEMGVPHVQLNWVRRGYDERVTVQDLTKDNRVISRLQLRAQVHLQNALFVCKMTSTDFPELQRTCEIGPITILRSSDNAIDSSDVLVQNPKESLDNEDTFPTSSLPDECSSSACASSSYTTFYLTLSTAAAGLLCVIFFTTTVVMCCKYHNISTEIAERPQQYTCGIREPDPVYVSLQRRRENEMVYMTLEDPNNPEGKVLLPREVFDEFCNRTLSLRKT